MTDAVPPGGSISFEIRPAAWVDFEAVMGPKGGCGGCWCMLWRRSAKEMEAGKGEGNRQAMKDLFAEGEVPGLVATKGDDVVGWIQIAPRSEFTRLASSRILKPIDEKDVWSVSCFFINKRFRRVGLSLDLLTAAVDWARTNGATIVEGYPIDTPKSKYPTVYAWTGFFKTFQRAGFCEVARRSETRPIMRKELAQR